MVSRVRSSLTWPMLAGLSAAVLALLIGLSAGGDPVEDWQLAARYTARTSFLIFILVYCARPIDQLVRSRLTHSLMRRRRWLGLGFALSHAVHLVTLLIALRVSATTPDALTLVGGGISYALILALALTSKNALQRRLGRGWKRLHLLAMHWLWIVFFFDYVTRIFVGDLRVVGLIGSSVALAAALIRLLAWLRAGRSAGRRASMNGADRGITANSSSLDIARR